MARHINLEFINSNFKVNFHAALNCTYRERGMYFNKNDQCWAFEQMTEGQRWAPNIGLTLPGHPGVFVSYNIWYIVYIWQNGWLDKMIEEPSSLGRGQWKCRKSNQILMSHLEKSREISALVASDYVSILDYLFTLGVKKIHKDRAVYSPFSHN